MSLNHSFYLLTYIRGQQLSRTFRFLCLTLIPVDKGWMAWPSRAVDHLRLFGLDAGWALLSRGLARCIMSTASAYKKSFNKQNAKKRMRAILQISQGEWLASDDNEFFEDDYVGAEFRYHLPNYNVKINPLLHMLPIGNMWFQLKLKNNSCNRGLIPLHSYSYPHRLFHPMPCTSSSLSYTCTTIHRFLISSSVPASLVTCFTLSFLIQSWWNQPKFIHHSKLSPTISHHPLCMWNYPSKSHNSHCIQNSYQFILSYMHLFGNPSTSQAEGS